MTHSPRSMTVAGVVDEQIGAIGATVTGRPAGAVKV
jgi:hypothetical protein